MLFPVSLADVENEKIRRSTKKKRVAPVYDGRISIVVVPSLLSPLLLSLMMSMMMPYRASCASALALSFAAFALAICSA
jgi:hypothetical protein